MAACAQAPTDELLADIIRGINRDVKKIAKHHKLKAPDKVRKYSNALGIKQTVRRQLEEQLRNAAAKTVTRWSRVPSGLEKFIKYEHGLQEGPLRQMLAHFEAELKVHNFPEKEGPPGQELNRWTKLLTKIEGLNHQDFNFVKRLGDNNLEWKEATEKLVNRLIRDLNAYDSSGQLDKLSQAADQSVLAFSEEFSRLRDRTVTDPLVDWRTKDLHSHFLFLKKLHPHLGDAVTHDHRWSTIKPTFPALVQLAISVEQETSSSLFFDRGPTAQLEPPAKKRKRHDSRRHTTAAGATHPATSDRGAAPATDADNNLPAVEPSSSQATGKQDGGSSCGRCGKQYHSSAKCRSEFNKSGARLDGTPPGLPADSWSPSGKTCKNCGSEDHLSFYLGCKGARRMPEQEVQEFKSRERFREALRVRAVKLPDHCTWCGSLNHATRDCPPTEPEGDSDSDHIPGHGPHGGLALREVLDRYEANKPKQ
jgi:hypothetical protein